MNLLHFILFVLLGFLASSAAAIPLQTVDVATGNIGQGVDRTAGRELAARQGYPSILLEYDLKCALDRAKTPMAPGSKKATDRKPSNQPWKLDPENRDWQVPGYV
ncbi:hypothetical protein INS49_004282 [Diaporthe citri]|uniref:uncharacterized protein n=1 Tax=Diaporthe citri TaxID=83186 RepID=UPI001C7FA0B0|nr:uncharacterized protein INS49_004282 [Diaporthe citri]KAG6355201.1 hypothetical protein INS49_004282 [Diaporthe citri]